MTNSSPESEKGVGLHPFFVRNYHTDNVAFDEAVSQFSLLVHNFEDLEMIEVKASEFLYADVITAFSRDIKKLIEIDGIEPDAYKIAGYVTFWIRKLKPLQDIIKDNRPTENQKDTEQYEVMRLFLNEKFALTLVTKP